MHFQYGVDEDTLEALLDRTDIVKEWKAKGGVIKEGNVNFNINCDDGMFECKLLIRTLLSDGIESNRGSGGKRILARG